MQVKCLDHTNKIIYLTDVTDDDQKLLEFLKYIHCDDIDFEDENGDLVEVYKPIHLIFLEKIGKWVAFKQEGMQQVLHGKVIKLTGMSDDCFVVKCKNGERRYVNMNDCYKFFDSKKECYEFKLKE